MPPDVTIVEEHKRDVSEAKQLDRKLVKLVLPTDKNEEKDKEDDKNEKVVLHLQHWMNAERFNFYISFFYNSTVEVMWQLTLIIKQHSMLCNLGLSQPVYTIYIYYGYKSEYMGEWPAWWPVFSKVLFFYFGYVAL